ncbi:MAG TPA: FAD-dependent monooxygenase [Variovorax sp.]|nr:FAD-dependent monooxygenase [Variovorax sp.]
MPARILVAGGGIGGLAAAVALARRGHSIEVLEQAEAFAEVGAGIQLGPNVTRRLKALNLLEAASRVAARPQAIAVRDAQDGSLLARLPLAESIERKYGTPYLCMHRADLHGVLLAAARDLAPRVELDTGACITQVAARGDTVCLGSSKLQAWEGDGLIGADGLWSLVRARVVEDSPPPRATGHTAWRALARGETLPARLRSNEVQVWLGERLHAVAYPVRGGDWLNLVVIAEEPVREAGGDPTDWDQQANLAALQAATGDRCAGVHPLIEAMPHWRAWQLNDRPPLAGPHEMVRDRVALLGDAAHPMLPYLAQGAGMAIEDAVSLAERVGDGRAADLPLAFSRYAAARWQRNARVQARSLRNGEVFHASGARRLARDAALRVLGSHLLDAPWLYEG